MELNQFPRLSRWEQCFRMRSLWLLIRTNSRTLLVIEVIASLFLQKQISEVSLKSASGLQSQTWALCVTVAKFLDTRLNLISLPSNPQLYQFLNQSGPRSQRSLRTTITLKLLFECVHLFQEKWHQVFSAQLPISMGPKIWRLLNILALVWTTRRGSTTCRKTLSWLKTISLRSTPYTGQRAPRNRSTRIQPGQLYCQFWKDTMPQFLPTVKLAQERHTPWKVSSTQTQIHREGSSRGVLKRFLITYKVTFLTVLSSWWGQATFKFTTKRSVTC